MGRQADGPLAQRVRHPASCRRREASAGSRGTSETIPARRSGSAGVTSVTSLRERAQSTICDALSATSACTRDHPTSPNSASVALSPAKSWNGSVTTSKRRASSNQFRSYSQSFVKSSEFRTAIHPTVRGSICVTSSRRTYRKPVPQGDSSHFWAPHARKSTWHALTSMGAAPTPWIASTMNVMPRSRHAAPRRCRSRRRPVSKETQDTDSAFTSGWSSAAMRASSSASRPAHGTR